MASWSTSFINASTQAVSSRLKIPIAPSESMENASKYKTTDIYEDTNPAESNFNLAFTARGDSQLPEELSPERCSSYTHGCQEDTDDVHEDRRGGKQVEKVE